jgi:hypothetical protein
MAVGPSGERLPGYVIREVRAKLKSLSGISASELAAALHWDGNPLRVQRMQAALRYLEEDGDTVFKAGRWLYRSA